MTTTAYHRHTDGQTEQYNKSIIHLSLHNVGKYHEHWDTDFQPLTYAYNAQTHGTMKITPFRLVLAREPLAPAEIPQPSTVSSQQIKPFMSQELRATILDMICETRARYTQAAVRARRRYKANFDK